MSQVDDIYDKIKRQEQEKEQKQSYSRNENSKDFPVTIDQEKDIIASRDTDKGKKSKE